MISFLGVGHGLCFIDSKNKFIYDCGGSINIAEFERIFPKCFKNDDHINIVISHHHTDHIKYLRYFLEHFKNAKVHVNKRFTKEWKVLPIYIEFQSKFNFINNAYIGGYFIYGQRHSRTMDMNKNSLLAENLVSNIFLTGDMPYSFINQSWVYKRKLAIFQIPHHGSASAETGNPTILNPHAKRAYVSYGVNRSFKHAHVTSKDFPDIDNYIEVHE